MSVHADPPPSIVVEPHGIKYVTGSQLGKGGFAICHRAEVLKESKPTGRIVALKIVKSKMEPAKLAQKFVTELQLHSKLNHPNIVEFYRAFSFEQNTYVVLELCENGSLADALKKRKFFTMPEIRRFIIQTCGAIKYLHHRNIVHRDLKTGNLFLDKNMNIKVGDFGLAAVLVSQNDLGMRRTTMCGTPNYLAPEILEKGGKGHNEKVDLWAIGIIAYTLAVGRAPFHAPKREDIYKKLQTRDYKWPDLTKHQNDISIDLRDLVGSLLVHEDDRPSPDQIVSHVFFRMAFIPEQLTEECLARTPRWMNLRPPTAEVIQRGYSDSWWKLCKEAGVGEFTDGRTFPVIGSKKLRSVVKDCAKELAEGRAPVVPIPADTVYLPFPERESWPIPDRKILQDISEEREPSTEGDCLAEVTSNERPKDALRLLASKPRQVRGSKENIEPARTERTPVDPLDMNKTVQRYEQPVTQPAVAAQISRPRDVKRQPSTRGRLPALRGKPVADVLVVEDSNSTEPAKQCTEKQNDAAKILAPPEMPKNKSMVPLTDPATVLARVSQFRDNIAQALQKKDTAPRRTSRTPRLPFVSKWVDYSRRHGVGYVLEDGSIGCLLNATTKSPVTHVVVHDGYSYLKDAGTSKDSSFIDRIPLEYYGEFAEGGIWKMSVDQDRKRSTGVLWAKFGRYMCQQLGQADGCGTSNQQIPQGTTFVRFYQRLGTVGIWGFSDGSFQFNFPDHTKLVLSHDARFASFTCLSVEAASHLKKHGELPFKYIRQRNLLSASLHSLVSNQQEKSTVDIVKANLLGEKLEFILTITNQWLLNGGLGCLAQQNQRIKWQGPQLEDAKKEDWVTIGRSGGDAPRSESILRS